MTKNRFSIPIMAYCRSKVLQNAAILSTFIKLPFVFKIFVLTIFEWPLKTGLTEYICPNKPKYLGLIVNFSYHQFKHLFWVLKRTVSMRRFFLSTHNICFGSGIRKLILVIDIIEYDCKFKQQVKVELYEELINREY